MICPSISLGITMVRDTASQDSCISERVKEQLNLRIKVAVAVSIFECGSEKAENKPYDSLEIYLHTLFNSLTLFTLNKENLFYCFSEA